MIRFDQRHFDVHETERVFKKVIHPTHGHNSIRLVDKDGIPLRPPNSAALSRLHSSYMLTPRGVPARKSTHSYSGQIAKEKMHNLVNTMDTTNSHEMASYASMHNYGLSSAGSSRHYIPSNLSSKKRTFGSGPPRSAKPMAKSASSERSRFLSVTPDEDSILDEDSDRWNGSPQGKRLEKEWAALSQCRALKRSSEIVSHRVDRMYFMTGNKLKLQQKYHVEDDELQHLKELSLSRASAKPSRSQRTRKGDVYRQDTSGTSSKTIKSHDSLSETGSQSDHVDGALHNGVRKNSRSSREEKSKENTDPASNIMVSQKPLTPKPSNCKSPLQGWAGDAEPKRTPSENGLINHKNDKSLHEDQADGMETPKSNEYINGTAENVQESRETEEVFQNNENKDSDNNAMDALKSKESDNNENNAIVDDGDTNQTVENTETTNNENGEVNVSGEVETEVRTENPVFVTQEEEEAEDQSVQKKGESDGSGEGQIENQEPKGEAIKTSKEEREKYDTD